MKYIFSFCCLLGSLLAKEIFLVTYDQKKSLAAMARQELIKVHQVPKKFVTLKYVAKNPCLKQAALVQLCLDNSGKLKVINYDPYLFERTLSYLKE